MTRPLKYATPAQRAELRGRWAEREAKEQAENDLITGRVLEVSPGVSKEEFDVLVIPSGFTETSKLSAERIQEYTENLRKIISKADDVPDAATAKSAQKMLDRAVKNQLQFAAEPALRDISNRICGVCRGGCCTAGGNAAFISSATVRRVKQQMPELSDEDILQAYLSRLPAESIAGACINQATTGCVLPTEMRSDTCNGFFCSPLSEWHDRPREERADKVLAIQRSEAYWNRQDLELSNHIVDVALVNEETSVRVAVDLKLSPPRDD